MKVTVIKISHENYEREYERVNLSSPQWECIPEINKAKGYEYMGGKYLQAIFVGPKSGRKFIRQFCCWGNGLSYWELTESEYLNLCSKIGIEPIESAINMSEV